ncbi:unnamed protein product [Rotaria magnacalcarata]|uniref:Transposase n=1 Tax=Rotaria magnacalcarata TaxID=392030 RepID=A0A816ND86_9BILA|nr:unnamed protein product [Rotaria magnacalcarata]CAF1527123.1 unnamed protein product [Rotaria magnacalcarata]CAF2034326.1 unnamed protein product [Rotaria magnacalcarata]CAF4029468.1 unnamed protein product [Rotaria magnacalcarata]CAF4118674.1 unnamed protein product [Rotaria magnacalcarata]
MKSIDFQNIVLSKYQNGDTPTKTFHDLNGGIGLRTIRRWCQMILQSGSITLSSPPGCSRLARTKGNIRKTIDRADADKNGDIKQKRKFPQKVTVWLGACSKGVTPLVILNEGIVNHAVYIEKVLPDALKYGNQVFGSDWVFQQDGAKSHSHHLTQQWCRDNFPSFIGKGRWLPNSPDLNHLDYSIWDELVNIINWNKVQSKKTLIQQIKSSF